MALWQSKQVAANLPPIESDGAGDVVHQISEFLVPAALANNDVIEMCGLPAYHVLTSVRVFSDEVDSGADTVTIDAGFISGTFGDGAPAVARTCGQDFLTASTTPLRAGGYTDPATTNVNMGRQTATTAARGVGIKIAAAIGTVAVGARIRMSISYIPDPSNLT